MEADSNGKFDKHKHGVPISSKELLRFESADYSDPFEKKYLLCNNQHPLSFVSKSGISSGLTSEAEARPIPPNNVLDRVKALLPLLKEENLKLEAAVKEGGAQDFDIETLAEDSSTHIQMDLALGIADLYTPEAISKAERVVNGQVLDLNASSHCHSSDTSSDESGYESEDDSLSKGQLFCKTNAVIRPKSKSQTFSSCLEDLEHKKFKRAKLEILDKEEASDL